MQTIPAMTVKSIRRSSPELYLIAATLYYWFLTSNFLNPIAIALLSVLVYQLLTKKMALGLIISAVFLFLNLYMVLALVSELSEFTTKSESYYQMLVIGSLFLGANILVSSFMIRKYIKEV